MNAPTKSALNYSSITTVEPIRVESGDERWDIEDRGSIVLVRDSIAPTTEPQPDDWPKRIEAYFSTIPSLAALGPKRITQDGKISSMGEFLIHPKGFHRLGQNEPTTCYRFPEEVDVIAGGFLAVNRDSYYQAGSLNHALGDLAAIDLCLKLRRAGGRCITIPDVIFETTLESSPDPTAAQSRAFYDRWGFDWRVPDLDEISAKHSGTGLLWNVRFWGCALPFEKYLERPAVHWKNYVEVKPYRERADRLIECITKLKPNGGLAVDLGCGDGLFTHLLALRGYEVLGIDPEEAAIQQARMHTSACKTYPGPRPRFELANGSTLPLQNETAQTVFMLDVIEHLPNPIGILNEAARVIKPGGHLFVTTPAAKFGSLSDPIYHITEYSQVELENQLNAVPGLNVIGRGSIAGIYRDILLAARKEWPEPTFPI